MSSFFSDYILFIPAVAYVLATLAKGIFYWAKDGFSISKALGTGGMPSGHSALVTSLATAVGIKEGVTSTLFTVCLVFAAIVIYDAMNIRYQSGLHAREINKISQQKFNESLGHLPSEALGGSILGILIAAVLMHI